MHVHSTLALALPTCLLLSGCTPELQPRVVCAPDVLVPYRDAPPGLVSTETQSLVDAYLALAGDWNAQMQCPQEFSGSGPVTASIRTDTLEEARVVAQADMTKTGIDCHHEGTVLAGGQMTLVGTAVGGLSGQTAALGATLDVKEVVKGKVFFEFDSSYDPRLESVQGTTFILGDLSLVTIVRFSFQPTRNKDGSLTQAGYDCGLTLVNRI